MAGTLRAQKLLDAFFDPGKKYTDADFQEIARLIKLSGLNEKWSTVPRIYTVLRTIGEPQLMDGYFLKEDFTDIWLPFIYKNLPPNIPGAIKHRFINTQSIAVTSALDLEKGANGDHATFAKSKDVPLGSRRLIGRGNNGTIVDKVESFITCKVFARKRLRRDLDYYRSMDAAEDFKNEVANLKKIDHEHCVKIVGSYTDPEYFALIMDPVAEYDLRTFFENVSKHPDNPYILRSFFGCLTSALQYLHEKKIRHKDIKPGNVLVNGDRVYLADFGNALDWSEMPSGTTTGDTAKTIEYCAPEVATSGRKSMPSDIWSLGCIFVEIITVLKGKTVEDMRDYFKKTSGNYRFDLNAEPCRLWLKILNELNSKDNPPIKWASNMLEHDPKKRDTADFLLQKIRRCSNDPSQYSRESFCNECCIRYKDPRPLADSDDEDATDERTSAESPGYSITIRPSRREDPPVESTHSPDWWGRPGPKQLTVAPESTPKPITSTGPLSTSRDSVDSYVEAVQLLRNNGFDMIALHNEQIALDADMGPKALHWAATHGYEEVVRMLLEKGADIHSRTPYSETSPSGFKALHLAAINGHDMVARLLLDKGADIESKDSWKQTALHWAAKTGHEMVVRLLLEKGADIESKDIAKKTALHCATQTDWEAVVRLLLEKGADIESREVRKKTALHFAAGEVVVRMLLEKGADVESKDHENNTALYIAYETHNMAVVELLLSYGAKKRPWYQW